MLVRHGTLRARSHWMDVGLGSVTTSLITSVSPIVPATTITQPTAGAVPPSMSSQQIAPLTAVTSTQPAPGTTTATDPLYKKLSSTPLNPGVPVPSDTDAAYAYALINIRGGTGPSAWKQYNDPIQLWNDMWISPMSARDAKAGSASGAVLTPGLRPWEQGMQSLGIDWAFSRDPALASLIDWVYKRGFPRLTTSPFGQPLSDNWRDPALRYYNVATDKNPGGFGYYMHTYIGPALFTLASAVIGGVALGPLFGGSAGAALAGGAVGAGLGTAVTGFAVSPPAALDIAPTSLSPSYNSTLLQTGTQASVPLMVTPQGNQFSFEQNMSNSPIPLTEEQETAMAAQDDIVKGLLVVSVLGAIALFGGK